MDMGELDELPDWIINAFDKIINDPPKLELTDKEKAIFIDTKKPIDVKTVQVWAFEWLENNKGFAIIDGQDKKIRNVFELMYLHGGGLKSVLATLLCIIHEGAKRTQEGRDKLGLIGTDEEWNNR